MQSRELPARPHLDHLKNEAKALRSAFLRGDAEAIARVGAALGPKPEIKLTDAQRVVAREYGFTSWAALRTHVLATRGMDDAVDAFLGAVEQQDRARALQVLAAEPRIAGASLHVAAVLGEESEVGRLLAENPTRVKALAGHHAADPLLWLCFSPFHGESPLRDAGLTACARALLDAGADPNTKDGQYGVPALYAVTGARYVPWLARMLLEAGANPTDGESVFHAAENFHEEALELLLGFGADLNWRGEWGNTPLYFLLRHFDVAHAPRVKQGLLWLLDHGADPNVRCGVEQESSLHVSVLRGQSPEILRLLLAHGADVNARRGDGRTPWLLARRAGADEIAALLEEAGAQPALLSPTDLLIAACNRGDAEEARRLASPKLLSSLTPEELGTLPVAAFKGRLDVVEACLAAGFPVDATDEIGATALHHASIRGRAPMVRVLLEQGADFRIHDRQHHAPPIGWACYGADMIQEAGGDYEDCVRALLEAGARPAPDDREPEHPGVRRVLEEFR